MRTSILIVGRRSHILFLLIAAIQDVQPHVKFEIDRNLCCFNYCISRFIFNVLETGIVDLLGEHFNHC